MVWAVLVPAATALGRPTLEFWSLNVYSAWYLWLLGLGVLLTVRLVGPPAEPVLEGQSARC